MHVKKHGCSPVGSLFLAVESLSLCYLRRVSKPSFQFAFFVFEFRFYFPVELSPVFFVLTFG